jgi:hypothetical protein
MAVALLGLAFLPVVFAQQCVTASTLAFLPAVFQLQGCSMESTTETAGNVYTTLTGDCDGKCNWKDTVYSCFNAASTFTGVVGAARSVVKSSSRKLAKQQLMKELAKTTGKDVAFKPGFEMNDVICDTIENVLKCFVGCCFVVDDDVEVKKSGFTRAMNSVADAFGCNLDDCDCGGEFEGQEDLFPCEYYYYDFSDRPTFFSVDKVHGANVKPYEEGGAVPDYFGDKPYKEVQYGCTR